MNIEEIRRTKVELKRCNDAINEYFAAVNKLKNSGYEYAYLHVPRESGAVRRASMDLTRQLARMRNGK